VSTSPSTKLEDAIELADLAERMQRARLQREHPHLDSSAIERRVVAWLHEPLGAHQGVPPEGHEPSAEQS
jgi:hypothetical protein